MARPKSEDKRNAIMTAASRVIVTHGLSVSTATIAQEAGVANGSLFTYFGTKSELFNELYLDLKSGMASAALNHLPLGASLQDRMFHLWSNWMRWAATNPEKRRALAQLNVSGEITPASRSAAQKTMAGVSELMEQSRTNGAMREVPKGFVFAIMNSLAEATMDFMVHDPLNADKHVRVGFEALWRVLS